MPQVFILLFFIATNAFSIQGDLVMEIIKKPIKQHQSYEFPLRQLDSSGMEALYKSLPGLAVPIGRHVESKQWGKIKITKKWQTNNLGTVKKTDYQLEEVVLNHQDLVDLAHVLSITNFVPREKTDYAIYCEAVMYNIGTEVATDRQYYLYHSDDDCAKSKNEAGDYELALMVYSEWPRYIAHENKDVAFFIDQLSTYVFQSLESEKLSWAVQFEFINHGQSGAVPYIKDNWGILTINKKSEKVLTCKSLGYDFTVQGLAGFFPALECTTENGYYINLEPIYINKDGKIVRILGTILKNPFMSSMAEATKISIQQINSLD